MNGQVPEVGSPTRRQFRLSWLLALFRRWSDGTARRKRYKYQALVTPLPQAEDQEAMLPGPVCRVVVRARHPETHRSKLFSALVTDDEGGQPGKSSVVTMVVVGPDADDYLIPGEHFALLRGREVARGTVTRRLYV